MRVSQRFLHRPIQMQYAEKSEPFFAPMQASDTTEAKNPFFAPSTTVQTKLEVNAPGDQYEQEADAMAEKVVQRSEAPFKEDENIQKMGMPKEDEDQVQRKCATCEEENQKIQRKTDGSSIAPLNVSQQINNTKGSGTMLPAKTRSEMESSFGTDFSDVRIHDNSQAAGMNDSLHAYAFTHGSDIYFNQGKFSPEGKDGKRLLAHELTHVVQQGGSEIQRTGKSSYSKARSLINQNDNLKIYSDKIKSALNDIKKGKSIDYNFKEGNVLLDNIGILLNWGKTETLDAKIIWKSLRDNPKNNPNKSRFLQLISNSDLKNLRQGLPKSLAHDQIRYTSESIFDLIIKVSDTDVTSEQLYCYAQNEGLAKLVQHSTSINPSEADLLSFDVSLAVDGFNYLGTDMFFESELNAKRHPLSKDLPKGFDLKKVNLTSHVNEKGKTLITPIFHNLETALIAQKYMLKRRRKLFNEDVKALGYSATTSDNELVFWTYVYFNPGENGGLKTLIKHKGKRKLSDWIAKGEFTEAQKVLQSYELIKKMNLF